MATITVDGVQVQYSIALNVRNNWVNPHLLTARCLGCGKTILSMSAARGIGERAARYATEQYREHVAAGYCTHQR